MSGGVLWFLRSAVCASAMAALCFVATASVAPASIEPINFDVTDSGFVNLPDTIPAGMVSLVMRNVGHSPHHAKLVLLNSGVTLEQYAAAVLQGQPTAALITTLGGNGVLDPGVGGDEVSFDLPPGTYVVLDVLRAADGQINAGKGLLQQVQVVDDEQGREPADQPISTANVTLQNFQIDGLPAALSGGRTTLRIDNAGPLAHELLAARLAPGQSADDLVRFMTTTQPSGVQPYVSVGGFQSMDQGFGGWSSLDLSPGEYAFFCNLTVASTGKRHFEEGMIQQVTVRSS
ncbi:MAG TPA: hypothetical protein VGQ62_24335 [Chloroflexota bacterium]|nr:hypothetical protein [Chloroflexota bacterium]